VADAVDELVTAIAYSSMADITACRAKELRKRADGRIFSCGLKGMGRVMTMLSAHMAWDAEVVIIASCTRNELGLWEDLHAGVASASRHLCLNLWLLEDDLLLIGECTRHLLLSFKLSLNWGFRLGCDSLGGAADNLTVLHKPLDEPVALTRTVYTSVNASLAKIVVVVVADAAVVMFVRHGLITCIAVDRPSTWRLRRGGGLRLPHTESEITLTLP